jgi:phage shock protein A
MEMGIFSKLTVLVKAHSNDLLDKEIDRNSIPVMKQYVRDLEDAITLAKHNAAVVAASVTTLTARAAAEQKSIDDATAGGKAFMAKNPPDVANARILATRVHTFQTDLASLQSQIETAKANSQTLDQQTAMMDAKHQEAMSQLRDLESKVMNTQTLQASTSSLKKFNDAAGGVDNMNNLSQHINSANDEATEEFNRTIGEINPPDPLKDQAVDNIMDSFKEPVHA